MKKITTVSELKKFLDKFSNNVSIYFADDNCEPCKPFSFEIGTVKDFIEEYVENEYQEEAYDNAMTDFQADKHDIVIYAEF